MVSQVSTIIVKSLAQEIADRIRVMIRKGELKIGDQIVEKRLCEVLGVSRTPLREALRLLSSEGLFELVPNKGAFVAQPSMEEVRQMFWVMGMLEGACARMCAERMTDKDLKELEKLHRQLEKYAAAKNREKYMEVNHRYHTLIQELAGNKTLAEVISGLRQKILLYRYRQIEQPNRLERSMEEHRNLHAAFRKRDPDAAESLMKEHLLKQCEALEGVYADIVDAGRHKRQ